jgi:D-amino-acid oxidase
MSPMDVRVIGAGIIGLSCALRLREAGHRVELVAAAPPEQSTSSVAAALWYPYRAFPEQAVTRWAARSYQVFDELLTERQAGVRQRTGRELFRAPAADPWWRDAVPGLRRVSPDDLPTGYADGFELTVPVVDMALQLPWLLDRIVALGVTITWKTIEDLDAAAADVDVAVNCTGLGARELAHDPSMQPVRGQIVVVEQIGVEESVLDQSDPRQVTYVVPRGNTVVLGGTAEDGDEQLEVRASTASEIVERCAALVPAVAEAKVLRHRVGLRPARPTVRLEFETRPAGGRLVHCYGHGGAGVTLSYGCAEDVVRLVEQS